MLLSLFGGILKSFGCLRILCLAMQVTGTVEITEDCQLSVENFR